VVFSEGFLHSPDMVPEMQGVIDAANRAGVAFYVIDASGPESRLDADVRQPDIGGHRADPDPAIDGFANALGQDVFDWSTTLTSDVHSDLGNIAHATGGFLVSGTNNLLAAIDRVALDSRDFYTLVYQPTNRHYDGAFRKIKVTLDAGGYRLRFRQGYWGIPPGQEVMMTPAGAQLLYALESNTRKPGFAPDIRAALVPSRDGRFAAPVSVSMPGSQVPFEKSKDRYSAGVTLLLVARNPHGQLVSLYERYGDLKFNKQEWEEFRRQTFNVIGHIPIPSMAAITVQAIIQFSSGAVGVSAQTPLGSDASSADVQLTSLVLSNRVEQADCSTDQTDPLCVKGLRVYLPAHAQFRNADKLTVYFSALGLTPDPRTQQPNLQVKFDLLSSDAVSPLAAERIQAVPGAAPGSLMVLAAFDLKDFKPGRYTLKANVEDTVVRAQSSGGADFSVEK
jgi:hypothetical protein